VRVLTLSAVPKGFTDLVEHAINGAELPDYAGVPDSGALAGPPITSSAMP